MVNLGLSFERTSPNVSFQGHMRFGSGGGSQ